MENKLIFLEMAEFQFGTFRIILIQEDDRYYVTTGIGSWNDYTFSLKWCYTFTEYEEAKKCYDAYKAFVLKHGHLKAKDFRYYD